MAKLRLEDFEGNPDMDRLDYEARLAALQHQLELIQAAYINQGRTAIIALEGWDAAGKGGLITRMVGPLDHRYTKVWSISAPTKQEAEHHYLWRFWQRLPGAREIAVFDRTWSGRVLIERIDGFAAPDVWARAYDQINAFEGLLAADGMRIVKLFLHITQEEQDKRLEERLETPWKRWKTGVDDYHNRSRRAAYWDAYHDMFDKTSTKVAPWTVIAANDKKTSRINGLLKVIDILGKDVDLTYPPVDPELRKIAEKALGKKLDL